MMKVSFAVNDEYGQTRDRIHAVDFGLEQLHLEHTSGAPMKFAIIGNHIRVGRRQFPFIRHISWYGNMMWEGFEVTDGAASEIAGVLRDSGKYAPDYGLMSVLDLWKAGKPIVWEGAS